jgi:hypothetical protein
LLGLSSQGEKGILPIDSAVDWIKYWTAEFLSCALERFFALGAPLKCRTYIVFELVFLTPKWINPLG